VKKYAVLSAVLLLALSPTFADTVSLSAEADTSISARDPNNNFGGDPHASSGRDGNLGGNPRRALLRFDLGSIPAGSTINSAVLKLTVVKSPTVGAVNSNFKLHRMTAGWIEGNKISPVGPGTTGNGAAADPGETTWNSRAHGIIAWTGGTGGTGDFIVAPSASTAVAGLGSYSWSAAQLAADAQGWLANSGQNYGWLLISDNEAVNRTARAFGAEQNTLATNRPVLEVDYTPPVPPQDIVIESFTPDTSAFELVWTGPTNLLYDVQYRTSLTDSNGWNTAEAYIESAAGSNVWNDVPLLAGPLQNPETFYRVQGLETSIAPLQVEFNIIATNLAAPGMLTHAGDGSGRLFVVEQIGRIRVINGSGLLPAPFLDISSLMTNLPPTGIAGYNDPGINPFYDERGLLGMAFHPNYASNGRFFIHYSAPPSDGISDNKSVIAEYMVSAGNTNLANGASGQTLLEVHQPEFNHAGGTITFGPDGYLYIGFGDGGGADDVHGVIGNGQNTTNLLGNILRIDIDSGFPYTIPLDNPFVSVSGFLPEIYAYGFRNPYRFSFDSGGSNELVVADVGQNLWEEIDIVFKGENHGWRITEGHHEFDLPLATTLGFDPATLSYPIHDYKHGPLGISVIGGFIYRGTAYPELDGSYVFGDFSTSFGSPDGKLYYLSETRPDIWQRFEFSIQPGGGALGRFVKGFGEGEDGEIYLLSDSDAGPSGTGGDVRKLVKP
jgi:glucose/arabinose dehydrogenase